MKRNTAMCLWKPVPQSKPFPCDRFKHACSICRGFVYLYGGRCNSSLSDFWRYNIASNKWEKLDCSEDGPEELEEHSMVAYQGILYIFGGMLDSAFTQAKIPLWMYDIDSARWTECRHTAVEIESTAPANRKGHSAVVYNSSMYIYGGYFDIKGISQEFWALRFDTGEWSQVSPLSCDAGPGPRHGHSAVVYGTGMYLFGGLMGLSEQRDLWKWDFTSCKWSTIRTSQRPPKVVGHSSVVFQDSMLTFGGGISNSRPNNSLWKYHFSSQIWEKLASTTEVILSSKRYHRILGIGVGFQLTPGFSGVSPINHWCPKGKEPQKLAAVSKQRAHFHGYFRQQPVHQPFSNDDGNEIEMKTFSQPLEPLGFCSFQTSSEAELCADKAQSIFSKNEHLSHLIASQEQTLTAAEVTKNRRGTDCQPETPRSMAVTNHPDMLFLIGGKPLSSLCEISLWQMELNSI
ncbi:tip elongation aberrant protein 3-like isoform X1 [Terrapene carolina triunguis]|uniref:tip elongation aberrant protein 3-like isoform X1 n=1 Tax=Terrapene triunguis TaxID=2587831 RepID=UPI000E7794E3|nr:tip elongation aberrant protein 3-like isoform X1 [Terrapene carolina triunguis]